MNEAAFRAFSVSLNVPREDIYYVSWNVDAAEGLGILKTEDADAGLVTIFTTGSMLDCLLSMIEGLRQEGVALVLNGITETEKITKR